MRFTVAATIAIAFAVAATTASAGVVLYQDVVVTYQTGKQHKSEQTVMIQGKKEKVVTDQRVFITDPEAGLMYILIPLSKKAAQLTFPPPGVMATMMVKDGAFVGIVKDSGTNKVAGYDCQNYSGTIRAGHYDVKVS